MLYLKCKLIGNIKQEVTEMIDSGKLSKKITESGVKKKFIAGKLGLSSYGLSKKINNENEFKVSEVEKICNILNLTADEREDIFFAKNVY